MFCKKSRFLPEPKRFLIRSFFLWVGSTGSNIVKLHFDAEIRSSHRVWRPRSSVLSLQGLNFIVIWLWFLVHLRNCIFFFFFFCCCYRSGNVRVLTAFAWLFYLYTSFMFCLLPWDLWLGLSESTLELGNEFATRRRLMLAWAGIATSLLAGVSWLQFGGAGSEGKKSNCWKQSTSISERWLLHASKVTFRWNWIVEWLVGVRKECFFSFLVIFFKCIIKPKFKCSWPLSCYLSISHSHAQSQCHPRWRNN